jgi:hypothetical protein
MAATAKNWPIDKAPKRVELKGDKTKKPESAQHIIEFPGGAIELSRTSDDEYWAQIIVNRGWSDSDQEGIHAACGEVVDSRVDSAAGILDVPNADTMTQIAVRIRAVRSQAGAKK